MVTYVVGVPGSGKTAYAVYKIKELHEKREPNGDPLYSLIYNNIGGFKHHFLERSKRWLEDDFLSFMKELHTLYRSHKRSDDLDDVLIAFTKKHGYFKSLIVIDECHNTFTSNAQSDWVWLLSYHRHLYLDFIFITQSMAMIPNSKLKNMAEVFIKALQPSLRIMANNFRYEFYENARMAKAGKYKTDTIKMTNEVFKYYKSGDVVRSKSIILKFIFYGFILLLVTFSIGYYAYSNFFKEDKKHGATTEKTNSNKKFEVKDSNSSPNSSVSSGELGRGPGTKARGEKSVSKSVSSGSSSVPKKLFELKEDYTFQNISCFNHYCDFGSFCGIPQLVIKYLISEGKIEVIKSSSQYGLTRYFASISKEVSSFFPSYTCRVESSLNNPPNKIKDQRITDEIF